MKEKRQRKFDSEIMSQRVSGLDIDYVEMSKSKDYTIRAYLKDGKHVRLFDSNKMDRANGVFTILASMGFITKYVADEVLKPEKKTRKRAVNVVATVVTGEKKTRGRRKKVQ